MAPNDARLLFTKLGLMRFGHLNKGRILFVEQDLHPMDITVNTCQEEEENKQKKTKPNETRTIQSRFIISHRLSLSPILSGNQVFSYPKAQLN